MNLETKAIVRRVLGRYRAPAYQAYLQLRLAPRRLTVSWRRDPDWVIIGAQKCGTASLFAYVAEHPQVGRSLKKEISYFNTHHDRGDRWYRAYFPLDRAGPPRSGSRFVTGEATPDYLFDPRVPARIATRLPDVRLIALLRDPVDRAFSHYRHNVRKGNESRSFEDALRHEIEVLEPELRGSTSVEDRERILVEKRRWFYLARGRYHEQIAHWLEFFPRDALLVLRSEDLFRDTARSFDRVLEFLGLDRGHTMRFPVHNLGSGGTRMEPATERWLREYFRPHNEGLGRLLGWQTPWALAERGGVASAEAAASASSR